MARRKARRSKKRVDVSNRSDSEGKAVGQKKTPTIGSTIGSGDDSRGSGRPVGFPGNGTISQVNEFGDTLSRDTPVAPSPTSLTSSFDRVPQEYRGYQNESEFRRIARKWQQQMQLKDFSTHPLDDSEILVVRRVAVLMRLRAALTEMPNPFAQAIRTEILSSTDKVLERNYGCISKLAEGDWVGAVVRILEDIRRNDEIDGVVVERRKRQYDHWCTTFTGKSLEMLQGAIRRYQSNWEITYSKIYSKSINIVQSSGMGKSRLADEMGKTNFQFAFNFTNPGDPGYPPGDTEIADYFRLSVYDPPTLAAGFYAALGCIGLKWYEEQSRQSPRKPTTVLASRWHDLMAPTRESEFNAAGSSSFDPQGTVRSKFRRMVHSEIVNRARSICEVLRTTPGKAQIDDDIILRHRALHELIIRPMERFARLINQGVVLVVFDEAANLDATVLYWLRRLQRMFDALPLWSLFLSRNNCIQTLVPADRQDSCSLIFDSKLRPLDPFLGLQLDFELHRRFRDRVLHQDELRKPLALFATCGHLKMFGRPLWRQLSDTWYLGVSGFVSEKLLSAPDIDTENIDHVFAVLSSRLCLVPAKNTGGETLVSNAVNRHLRVATALNQTQSKLKETIPTEPIVAEAAASILTFRPGIGADRRWPSCIRTFRARLLRAGLIENGVNGELYAQLLMVLARDYVSVTILKSQMSRERDGLTSWSRPFSLFQFLHTLIGSDGLRLGSVTPTTTVGSGADLIWPLAFREALGSALLNFTHFISTETHLQSPYRTELLHDLMRQCAALQLSSGQATWDLLIPMYLGDPNAVFDPESLSAIVISAKNATSPRSLKISSEDLDFFKGLSQAVVAILLDLGVTPGRRPIPQTQLVKHQNRPPCFGFRVEGSDSGSFAVLHHQGLRQASGGVLPPATQNDSHKYDTAC